MTVSNSMSTRLPFVLRFVLFALLLTPVSAYAQQSTPRQPAAQPAPAARPDQPTFGLVASSTGSIGFMWNYSERLAFRPELGWTTNSSSSSASTTTTDSTSVSPGIAVLYYTAKWDAVKAYVSPRYAFNHNSTTTTAGTTVTSGTANTNNFTGSIGAEYQAHRHFAAFGEVGLNYAHSSSSSTVTTTVGKNNSWGFRTAVGAIYYF